MRFTGAKRVYSGHFLLFFVVVFASERIKTAKMLINSGVFV
jgi:hypothetical protein